MENIDLYWKTASDIIAAINLLIEGWLLYRFIRPFTNKKSYY